MNALSAWLLLLAYLSFALPPVQRLWRRAAARMGEWVVFLFLLPFLLATGFRPALSDLARMAIFLALPTICLRLRPRDARPFDLWHVLAVLFIWVPLEPSLFTLLLDLAVPGVSLRQVFAGVNLLPGVHALLMPGVSLPVDKLTGVLLTLFLFLAYRPLPDVGFSWHLHWRDLRNALVGLLAFALIGLPVGVGLGFLDYSPLLPDMPAWLMSVVGGYLLIALPEELLFRGVIQNALRERLKRDWLAWPVAALIFGLAHLNNSTTGFPVPNWAYALMATLAGLAYGWVWWRTRKVTASALTHMLVNLIWGIVFPS